MLLIILVVVLIAVTIAAARARDIVVTGCSLVTWIGAVTAFGALWATDYRWANTSGCREAFPEHFGYRAPNWEIAPAAVTETRSWWPIGFSCSGESSTTGQFVTIHPGWALSALVSGAAAASAVALLLIAVRLVTSRRRVAHHPAPGRSTVSRPQ